MKGVCYKFTVLASRYFLADCFKLRPGRCKKNPSCCRYAPRPSKILTKENTLHQLGVLLEFTVCSLIKEF